MFLKENKHLIWCNATVFHSEDTDHRHTKHYLEWIIKCIHSFILETDVFKTWAKRAHNIFRMEKCLSAKRFYIIFRRSFRIMLPNSWFISILLNAFQNEGRRRGMTVFQGSLVDVPQFWVTCERWKITLERSFCTRVKELTRHVRALLWTEPTKLTMIWQYKRTIICHAY